MSFKGRYILSAAKLTREDILKIMKVTEEMEKITKTEKVIVLMSDMLITVLSPKSSTPIRLPFETAVYRLGAKSIIVASTSSSSVAKGESLEDTEKTVYR